jgi:hypothetical protein
LSGVFVGCGGVLYARLWKCGPPECCPSCIASSSSISAGQGLAGNGCGPVHLKCRLLRARLYVPIFATWWFIIIMVIGARFNSLLGGSAIRPANDAYYFLAVMRSSPFLGVAVINLILMIKNLILSLLFNILLCLVISFFHFDFLSHTPPPPLTSPHSSTSLLHSSRSLVQLYQFISWPSSWKLKESLRYFYTQSLHKYTPSSHLLLYLFYKYH